MANVVEFILQMKDLMSNGMRQAGNTAKSAMDSAQKAVNEVEDAATKAGNAIKGRFGNARESSRTLRFSIAELEDKLRDVNNVRFGTVLKKKFNEASAEAKRLERQIDKLKNGGSGGGLSGGGKGLLGTFVKGNLIANGISQLGSMASSAVSNILSATMQKESDIVSLTTFLGKDAATQAYKNIQKDAAATPFDTASLLDVNKALIAAGADAKSARNDTLNLANAVSAVGEGNDVLQRMAANMQQIRTVGQASSLDIKQFAMAGINIYQLLADATGRSIDQVKTMSVSYDLLSSSLQKAASEGGLYFGAMAAQSQTLAGRWNTFKDNLSNAFVQVGDAFSPLLNAAADLVAKFGEALPGAIAMIQPYIAWVNDKVLAIVSYVRSTVTATGGWGDYLKIGIGYVKNLFSFVGSLLKTVFDILGGLLGWLGRFQLVKDLLSVIQLLAGMVFKVVGWIADKLKWLFDNVILPILNAIDTAYKWVRGLVTSNNEIKVTTPDNKPNAAIMALMNKYLGKSPTGGATVFTNDSLPSSQPTGSVSDVRSPGVTSGGPKTITININKEMVGSLAVNSINVREGLGEIENMVGEILRRMLMSVAAG